MYVQFHFCDSLKNVAPMEKILWSSEVRGGGGRVYKGRCIKGDTRGKRGKGLIERLGLIHTQLLYIG